MKICNIVAIDRKSGEIIEILPLEGFSASKIRIKKNQNKTLKKSEGKNISREIARAISSGGTSENISRILHGMWQEAGLEGIESPSQKEKISRGKDLSR
jgi:hypothetical protein